MKNVTATSPKITKAFIIPNQSIKIKELFVNLLKNFALNVAITRQKQLNRPATLSTKTYLTGIQAYKVHPSRPAVTMITNKQNKLRRIAGITPNNMSNARLP